MVRKYNIDLCCSNSNQLQGTSIFTFQALFKKYEDFSLVHRREFVASTSSTICSAHFSSDCFTYYGQFSCSYAKILSLHDDEIPTIYPPAITGQ